MKMNQPPINIHRNKLINKILKAKIRINQKTNSIDPNFNEQTTDSNNRGEKEKNQNNYKLGFEWNVQTRSNQKTKKK